MIYEDAIPERIVLPEIEPETWVTLPEGRWLFDKPLGVFVNPDLTAAILSRWVTPVEEVREPEVVWTVPKLTLMGLKEFSWWAQVNAKQLSSLREQAVALALSSFIPLADTVKWYSLELRAMVSSGFDGIGSIAWYGWGKV